MGNQWLPTDRNIKPLGVVMVLPPCLMYFWLPQLWGTVIRLQCGLLIYPCGVLSMWACPMGFCPCGLLSGYLLDIEAYLLWKTNNMCSIEYCHFRWHFEWRRMEWRYLWFDNIQDGGWRPSWYDALSRVTLASAGLSCNICHSRCTDKANKYVLLWFCKFYPVKWPNTKKQHANLLVLKVSLTKQKYPRPVFTPQGCD